MVHAPSAEFHAFAIHAQAVLHIHIDLADAERYRGLICGFTGFQQLDLGAV
jgi:hypothetical protein